MRAVRQPDPDLFDLINPRTGFDSFNIQLRGIRPEHAADATHFVDALDLLLPLLRRHHLIQHSSFDKQAINAAYAFCELGPPDLRWSDSVTIARRAWPEWKGNGGHGLAHLKRKLDLRFHHHDAAEDARAAAIVVLRAEAHLSMPFEQLILPLAKARYVGRQTRVGVSNGLIAGFTVVFTGSLSRSRETAADIAAGAGMTVRATVTKQTTRSVVGNQDLSLLVGHTKSSKHRKAEEMQQAGHPIRILGETQFREVLAGAGSM